MHSKGTQGSAEAPHALGSLPHLEIDMKKVILALSLVLLAGTASAQHWHGHGFRPHGYYGGYYGGGGWVAPLIIGGVVGAAIANRPTETVVVQQPSVVVQNPPVIVQRQTVCTEWKEIQNTDGTIYRERTCSQ